MLINHQRYVLIYTLIAFISINSVCSQNSDSLSLFEIQLAQKHTEILNENIFKRSEKSTEFYETFCDILQYKDAFHYPFDSLKGIGSVYSPDNRIRIISWNIPHGYDDNLYYGVILFYSQHDKNYRLVKLNEKVNFGQDKFRGDWPEGLYYEIIETKHAGQRYYTLLGFHFNSPLSNRKIIDVISIDEFDDLYFAKNLFIYQQKPMNRVSFEYNEKAVMSLKYSPDIKMIVFDHLSPSKPSLEGKFEFYGPDFTYDGFKWEKGVWTHYSNIDVTN